MGRSGRIWDGGYDSVLGFWCFSPNGDAFDVRRLGSLDF